MELKLNALIPMGGHFKRVEVFGYTSRSQPGLEVIGLNGRGRAIKEKITYLTKKRRLKLNLLRYVLCVEGESLSKGDLEYLELPLLICFWTMAGILKISRLDNCLCAGKVSLEGEIEILDIPLEILYKWNESLEERARLMFILGGEECSYPELSQIKILELSQLLSQSIEGMRVVA